MNVIAFGAHPDDIEIGAGGTLARHVAEGDRVMMVVLTGGERGGADTTTRVQELKDSAKILGVQEVVCLDFPDTDIPESPAVVDQLDALVAKWKPKRAYIPFTREIHQDHRRTSEQALVACRNMPQILMYEGPSTFPDFEVNYWVDITTTIDKKSVAIAAYGSQGEKEILKIDAIRSLNRFRGFQARGTYAEGFHVFRFIE